MESSEPPSTVRNVVIVGGGIIGATSALFLSRHPNYNPKTDKITIVEACEIACAASGKAGGLVASWAFPSSLAKISFELHQQLAQQYDGANRWGYRRTNICSITPNPTSHSTKSDQGPSSSSPQSPSLLSQTLHLDQIPPDLIDSKQESPLSGDKPLSPNSMNNPLAWFSEDPVSFEHLYGTQSTAQVDPHKFTTAMAELARKNGVQIVYGKVDSINFNNSRTGIHSVTIIPRARNPLSGPFEFHKQPLIMSANIIIIAAGPWSSTLLPSIPVKGQRVHSVLLRPKTDHSNAKIPYSALSVHNIPSLEIYTRPDGTIYVCGEPDNNIPIPDLAYKIDPDPSCIELLLNQIKSVSSRLGSAEIISRRTCYLPNVFKSRTDNSSSYAFDSASEDGPLIGFTSVHGLILATGHSCWGISNAPATADAIAQIVMATDMSTATPPFFFSQCDPRRWKI